MTTDTETQPTATAAVPNRAIAMLALAAFASAANVRVCDVLLPDIATEFEVTVGQAAFAVTAFLVAYGVFQLIIGPLGDRFGKYRMVAYATLGAALVTALNGIAGSLLQLSLFRALSGMFAGAIIPLALAWLGDVVAYADRQPVIARFLSGQILGIVLGQAIGGAVTEVFGWRATLAVIGGFHLVAGLGMLFEMRRTPSTAADGRGQRLAASRIITATLDLLARPWVRTLLLIGFAEAIVFYGALAYVGSELRQRFGISAGTGGLMLACFGAGALIYAMTAARMISLLGQTGLALAGGAILAAAFLLLAVTPVLWLAPAGTAGLGLGFYMLHNTLQTNVTQMAPEARGLAVSQFAFWLFAGQSSGAALGGAIFDRYGGRPLFALAAVALPLVAIWFWRAMVRRQASGR